MILPTQNRWERFSGVVPLCYVIKQEFSNHEMKSSLKFSANSFGSPSSPNPTFPLTLEMKKFRYRFVLTHQMVIGVSIMMQVKKC